MGDDELEIASNIEDYRSDKLMQFNHQALVMEILRKVNEAGCHEMKSGFFNTKEDAIGNVHKTYVEDTRLRFIECVKSAKGVMMCDFDEKAKTKINEILESLKTLKTSLLTEQSNWWKSLTPKYQEQYFMKGQGISNSQAFNINHGWYQLYIESELNAYRKIVEELNLLTQRLDFYQTEDFVG